MVTLMSEIEDLGSGPGSGDGGKGANCRTCLRFPLGLRKGGVSGDAQVSSLDT